MKIKVKDIKDFLCIFKQYCEVFKSGHDVVVHITDNIFERRILNTLRAKNLLCIPEEIPTNNYYIIRRK